MKLTKSLMLGSAAVFVGAAAQAADLAVKAEAIEYVKVCSLYGAGFYYIRVRIRASDWVATCVLMPCSPRALTLMLPAVVSLARRTASATTTRAGLVKICKSIPVPRPSTE